MQFSVKYGELVIYTDHHLERALQDYPHVRINLGGDPSPAYPILVQLLD